MSLNEAGFSEEDSFAFVVSFSASFFESEVFTAAGLVAFVSIALFASKALLAAVFCFNKVSLSEGLSERAGVSVDGTEGVFSMVSFLSVDVSVDELAAGNKLVLKVEDVDSSAFNGSIVASVFTSLSLVVETSVAGVVVSNTGTASVFVELNSSVANSFFPSVLVLSAGVVVCAELSVVDDDGSVSDGLSGSTVTSFLSSEVLVAVSADVFSVTEEASESVEVKFSVSFFASDAFVSTGGTISASLGAGIPEPVKVKGSSGVFFFDAISSATDVSVDV